MLRVRLDCCDIRDGVVFFEGVPLSGIGAEVGSESVVRGVPAGVVSLWKYEEGRRVGAWIEPWFSENRGTILDSRGNFDSTDGMGSIIFDNARLDGLQADFDGPLLVSLRKVVDGELQPKHAAWRPDGSTHRLGDYSVVETGLGIFQVRVGAAWGTSIGGPSVEEPATRVGTGISRGEMRSLPRIEAQFEGDIASPLTFVAFKPGDQLDHRSGFGLELDDHGRINLLSMTGVDHFEMMVTAGIEPTPISWLVGSLNELSEFEVGSQLNLKMAAECLDLIIDALGGFEALGAVERLVVPTYDLRPDQVAALLELPALIDVEVTEQERHRAPGRGIRELCQAFKDRRPHARVLFDKQLLEPSP